jgi:hypothetical protein
MINYKILLLLVVSLSAQSSYAQETVKARSAYGRALNIGLGVGGYGGSYGGYYGYLGRNIQVVHFDYEFDVARYFTLAPFINYSSSTREYYWGNNQHPYKYYRFQETVVPIGVKGTYYLNKVLRTPSKLDVYLAGSLGFAIVNSRWDSDYYGDRQYYNDPSPLFLNIHLGAEYHINKKFGVYLDLSTGVSTIGVAFH